MISLAFEMKEYHHRHLFPLLCGVDVSDVAWSCAFEYILMIYIVVRITYQVTGVSVLSGNTIATVDGDVHQY